MKKLFALLLVAMLLTPAAAMAFTEEEIARVVARSVAFYLRRTTIDASGVMICVAGTTSGLKSLTRPKRGLLCVEGPITPAQPLDAILGPISRRGVLGPRFLGDW